MEVSHTFDLVKSPAAQRLGQFVRERECAWQGRPPNFEQFERDLHGHLVALEQELLATELRRYDVDAEEIEVAGVRYQPVWVDSERYLTGAGEVSVQRHLYRPAGHNSKSICPLELRVGIVDGYWTPRAARQGAWVTAQLPPGDAAALFVELGAMSPSRSTLDRLPRELSARWEAQREAWEVALRARETVPLAAVSVAFSVDGVMVAMKAKAAERVAKQAEAGKHASGPAGRQEAACGTVSLYEAAGERLQTIRYARMPESKKVTLQAQLQGEIAALYALRPDLRRVHLADGAETNWDRLAEIEVALGLPPEGRVKIVDFYHGCEHLKNGCDAIWGESTPRSQAEFLRLKTFLKEEDGGADRTIRAFKHHVSRTTGHRQQRIQAELTYFRNQRPRMNYPEYLRQNLPIASGVVEAACKTLVTQRLKRSGMAWTVAGGQAILTLRSLIQSGRWSPAWDLLAADFRQPITMVKPATAAPLQNSLAAHGLDQPITRHEPGTYHALPLAA
jgi:hypothetical protein